MKKYKTYDCFPYDGEKILDLRLKVLFDYVDYFIIGESNISFSGKKKKFQFNINNYSWAKEKIRYYKFYENDYKSCSSDWDREKQCRNLLIKGLSNVSPNDRILLSDCDEIFNPFNLEYNNSICVYDLMKSRFFADYVCINNPIYRHAVSFKAVYLKKYSLYQLREAWQNRLKLFDNQKIIIIKNGGWHFSYLDNPKKIIFNKIKKFPKDFIPNNKVNINFLRNNTESMIRNGIDIYFSQNLWGRVKNYHLNNQIVEEWFRVNFKFLSPKNISYYGSIYNIYKIFYFNDKYFHIFIIFFKFFLKIRNKIFILTKIKLF